MDSNEGCKEHSPRDNGIPTEESPLLGGVPSSTSSSSRYLSSSSCRRPPSPASPDPNANKSTRILANIDVEIASDGGWLEELWLLVRYSVPLIATYLLQYSWCVIVTFVSGHLSADDLAAASLAMTTMNIVGFAFFEGMATALDTLCSQAFGSGNLHGVGLHVQCMLVFMSLVCLPVAAVWAAAPRILSLFVQQQHLPAIAGVFLRVSILGIPGYAFFEAGKRFLQAQGSFRVALVILVICTPINILLSWLFAFNLNMGLAGAALGVAITNTLRPVLLLLYIISPMGRWSHRCWGGLSWASALSVRRWRPMARLSFAGCVVNLAEWGSFQIVAFSTSYLGTRHLATQTLLTTISIVSWHIPFSMSVGISTRIGNLIGAGLVDTARRAAFLYACIFLVVGTMDGMIIFTLRDRLPGFFSEDPIVRALASKTILAMGIFQIVDAFICFTNGMLRGLGRQSFAAWVVIIINYAAAVPLAIWLELGPAHLGLNGVWIGLGSGMVIIVTIECLYLTCLDWHALVNRVSRRNAL